MIFHTLKRYKLELLDETIPYPKLAITMHPGKRVKIKFTRLASKSLV